MRFLRAVNESGGLYGETEAATPVKTRDVHQERADREGVDRHTAKARSFSELMGGRRGGKTDQTLRAAREAGQAVTVITPPNAPLTPDQRRRIARAPISVGILGRLATHQYGGCSTGGCSTTADGPRVPVLDKHQHVTGWLRGVTREG